MPLGLRSPCPLPPHTHSIFTSFVAWTPLCAGSRPANTQGLPAAEALFNHCSQSPPMQEGDSQCIELAYKSSKLLTLEEKNVFCRRQVGRKRWKGTAGNESDTDRAFRRRPRPHLTLSPHPAGYSQVPAGFPP